MKVKRVINKWQIGVRFGKSPSYMDGFHPYFTFWFLKLRSFSEEGVMISKENYVGILIDKVWSPIITSRQRTFRIFGRTLKIVYPIRIEI